MITVKKEVLTDLGSRLLIAAGVSIDEAAWIIDCLVRSNLKGVDSHGVQLLPWYVNEFQKGKIIPNAKIEILKETPVVTIIDGCNGFGYTVARQAMDITIRKAKEMSIAITGVQNIHHIGRVGRWVEMALEEDMIGIASQPGGIFVAPWGGIDRKLPINPIAIAIPTASGSPFVIDFSLGPIAGGRISILQRRGIQVPEGWLMDDDGNITRDPHYGVTKGAQLPLGQTGLGYKGYALSMVLSVLTGPLIGAYSMTQHRPTGVFFSVINIDAFMAINEFKKGMDDMIADIKGSRLAKGFSEILIAGEPEYRVQQRRLTQGIPLDNSVWQELVNIANKLKINTSDYQIEMGGVSLHPSYMLKDHYE